MTPCWSRAKNLLEYLTRPYSLIRKLTIFCFPSSEKMAIFLYVSPGTRVKVGQSPYDLFVEISLKIGLDISNDAEISASPIHFASITIEDEKYCSFEDILINLLSF